MEDIEFWMNFVVENSNKLQQIGFRREIELSVFTFGANNTCYFIYPWRKVVFFCFVKVIFLKPHCFRLSYGTCHQKFSMNRGATTWFRMFGATMWNLFIIEPFFHWIKKKPRLKTILELGGVLDIIGKPSPSSI